MMQEYLPKDRNARLFRVLEEMGEVTQAIGKSGRFGMANRDPRTGITNAQTILDEITDLRHALDAVEPDLVDEAAKASLRSEPGEAP